MYTVTVRGVPVQCETVEEVMRLVNNYYRVLKLLSVYIPVICSNEAIQKLDYQTRLASMEAFEKSRLC